MHFAEEPIIRGGDEDDDDEADEDDCSDGEVQPAPFPATKQRLIRKDTPHYKKHFKITKLPKPEAVAALLESFSTEANTSVPRVPSEEQGGEEQEEESVNTPQLRRPEVADQVDSRLNQVNSSLQPVKVRLTQSRIDTTLLEKQS